MGNRLEAGKLEASHDSARADDVVFWPQDNKTDHGQGKKS